MKSRKIERKNARKEKKMRRNMYYKRKPIDNNNSNEVIDQKVDEMPKKRMRKKVKFNTNNSEKHDSIDIKDKGLNDMNKSKKKTLSLRDKRLIKNEEMEIKRYEKKLKLNKRRKKGTLPQSFHLDGLAFVLDVVDNTNIYDDNHNYYDQQIKTNNKDNKDSDQSDVEHHFDQDFDNEEQIPEEINGSEDSDSHAFDRQEDKDFSESDNESDNDDNEETINDDNEETINEPKETLNHKLKEDIYGFLRDSDGKIVKEERIEEKSSVISKVNQQLLRQIRGAFNRLTVNNMLTISAKFEEIFKQNSRHEVNEALWSYINSCLIDLEYSAPLKLTSEVSILIAILHSTIGEEIGGHAIHTLISKFDDLLKQVNDSKSIDNVVLVILNLYICGLIESLLIYDIITKLCDIFNEKCIELINLILKSVGFVLRKDNPIKMKELVLKVQNLALNIDKNSLSGNRMSFVLDSLIAIKNNNKSKLKGYGSVIEVDLIGNTLKSTLKKARVNSIPGRYDAVVQSSHWYSYTQNIEAIGLDKTQSNDTEFDNTINEKMNDRLLKALRLNTPLRKTIFIAISTCNDYIDAAHRLISVGKKQFSEVINVLLHVAIHEKKYNPFYLHLFQHLSKCDRKYRIALDFSIRDKISDLESLELSERNVLAQLIFELLKLNVLSITCLKVVHFSDMNETYVQFIKRIIAPILREEEELIQQILSKIPNKDSFATAIRLFISCFIDAKYKLNKRK